MMTMNSLLCRCVPISCVLAFVAVASAGAFAAERIESEAHAFTLETVVDGLAFPWSLAFLPDGRMLVTERAGRLRVIEDGRLLPEPIAGLPAASEVGQGGLLDVQPHPDFAANGLVYLSYAASGDGGYGTEVARGRLADGRLEDVEVVFRALPKFEGGRHFGSRLVFLPDGHLLVTLGDRGHRPNGQNLGTHPGSVIRIAPDGTLPEDNPFHGFDGVAPGIYTYGNRNVQGAALDTATGTVWLHEHGPQGGDEVNRLERGANYGWAEITYGRNYGSGTRIGEGETREGVTPPVHQWTPSIAPSGLAFYDGDAFPDWRGDLFVGSLKFRLLARLVIEDGKVVHEERLLQDRLGRIRDVRQGPDGLLYLLTDAPDGRLVRLRPAATQ